MRFIAPSRAQLDHAAFAQPPLSLWSEYMHWLQSVHFPTVEELNAGWDARWRFVEQTPQLLADGLHYETRIHVRGDIATRADNWHDFFNALVWRRFPALKQALNTRQVGEIAVVGDKQRSRAQCALTHFDEGGVIVLLRDAQLLDLWDAHNWHGLFWRSREAWREGLAQAQVFGHALLEMALVPGKLITGKALAVFDPHGRGCAAGVDRIAAAIAAADVLNDPQELRALPISGIPGWHAATADEAFYREGECFRPLRAGRCYPPPLRLD
jgi:Protein of unknown function (DUF3025)